MKKTKLNSTNPKYHKKNENTPESYIDVASISFAKKVNPDKNIKSPHIHRDNSEDIHNNEEIYTPELKEFVYNYYKDDFEKLGYEYISQA